MFAIVDIETTGGTPQQARILEICVVITDGKSVQKIYETLLNPGVSIPAGITSLTGITNDMIRNAPSFASIAQELHHMLHDKIFVAHNVNFDYGFISSEFGMLGIPISLPRLCSVKLARKVFKGRRSYSLGSICASLGIEIENRHRAAGDALATAELFHRCAIALGNEALMEMSGKSVKHLSLPPAIEMEVIQNLPTGPGIYYFMDNTAKPLYIGKAINIQKRVLQHFDKTRGKSALQLERIAHIDFEETGNEFMALLTEADAISKHWPEWNKAGKHGSSKYTLVHYPAQSGEYRVHAIKKSKSSSSPFTFTRLLEARNALARLISENGICNSLVHSDKTCPDTECYCKLEISERRNIHNSRVEQGLFTQENQLDELLVIGRGRNIDETGIVHIKNGAVLGWGFADNEFEANTENLMLKKVKDIAQTRNIAAMYLRNIKAGIVFGYKTIPIQASTVVDTEMDANTTVKNSHQKSTYQ